MLDILLSAVILHEELSSSAFVDDEKNCYGESHEEAETDHKQQFAHQIPKIDLLDSHTYQKCLGTLL